MMKQGKRKIIAFCVTVIAIMLFVFSTAIAEDTTETPTPDSSYWKVIKYEEIEKYRDNPEIIDGYLFAGWFADKSCAQETALTRSVKTGTAYAKYVPEEILGLKAQVNGELWNKDIKDDGTGAIRFVTSVDSLDYAKVGFLIDIGNGEKEKASNIVYKELYVKVGGDTAGSAKAEEFKPNALFHASSIYFKAWTITDVPELNYLTEFTVTPFWITLDGTTVKGTTGFKTVNQGRSWEYVIVDDTGSDNGENDNEIGLGTYNKPYKTLDYALEQMSEYQIKKNILKYSTNTTDTDGKVYVKTSLTADSNFAWNDHDLDVTITGDTEEGQTANFSTVDFSEMGKSLTMGDGATFENMTLKLPPSGKAIYANGNRLQISESVVVDTTNKPNVFGGNGAGTTVENTHVTLHAGTYNYIYGGSNGADTTVTGDTYVCVGGKVSGVRVYGGSYNGTVEGDTYVTVGGEANLEYVFGSGQNSSQKVLGTCYVTVEGNAEITQAVQGGGTGGSTNNTYVVVKGGTMEMVCGGQGTAGGTVNNTNVHILGGTITRRVYGGSYNDYKLLGGWQSSNEVKGYSSVTIGAFDAISGRDTNQDDTSISAASRIGSNPEKEAGVMIIGSDVSENKIGWSSDMKNLVGTKYTHFLVKVGNGGTVTSESGILRITPDASSKYAIVKDGDTELFQCQGEGTYSLSGLATPSDVKTLTVEFVDSASLSGDYVLSYEDSEGNVYGTSAFSSLKAAMASVSTPNIEGAGTQKTAVITINSADVTVNETIALTNSKNVVLKNKDGVNVTITRATESNMFDVADGCTLTIDGKITVDGDKDNVTGPAMIKNAGTFVLGEEAILQNATTACTSNAAAYNGAALYNTGIANIYGDIKNNKAYNGGAICIDDSNGVVNLYTESGASISGNTATNQGGAIYINRGVLNAEGYSFTENKSTGSYGGAIYINAYMSGATLYMAEAELSECVFGAEEKGNSGRAGGAIFVAGSLKADHCTFKYNKTTGLSGGAIDVSETNANFDASFMITNSSFENNTSEAHGGAIDINGGGSGVDGTDNFQIIDCTFSGNSSKNGNTISVRQAGAQVDVSNVTFEGDASGNADVIYLDQATNAVGISGEITGVVVKVKAAAQVLVNDTVDADSDITITPSAYTEGLQVMDKANDTVDAEIFADATEILAVTRESGNYWYITSEGKLSSADAKINGEEGSYEDALAAIANGGEVEIQFLNDIEIATTITIPADANVTVKGADDVDVTITRATTSNMFNVPAGATLTIGTVNSTKKLTIDGADLSGTSLIKNAGTFVTNNNVTIKNVNAGDNNGGVLNNAGTATLNGIMTGNTAKQGAVAYNTGTVTIKTGTYSNNTATSGGVVVRCDDSKNAKVYIEAGLFAGNEAQGATGGVISGNAKEIKITGGTFQNNIAANGGSVMNVAGTCTATVSNVMITGNSLVRVGTGTVYNGAIYVSENGKLTLENCNIYGNQGYYNTTTNPGCDVSLGKNTTLSIKDNTSVGAINKRDTAGTIKFLEEYTGTMMLIPPSGHYNIGDLLVTFDDAMTADEKANTVANIIVRKYTSKTDFSENEFCVDTAGKLQNKSEDQ